MSAAPDKAAHKTWPVGLGDTVEGRVIHGDSGCTALSVLDDGCPSGRCLDADLFVLSETGFDGIEVAGPAQSCFSWREREC